MRLRVCVAVVAVAVAVGAAGCGGSATTPTAAPGPSPFVVPSSPPVPITPTPTESLPTEEPRLVVPTLAPAAPITRKVVARICSLQTFNEMLFGYPGDPVTYPKVAPTNANSLVVCGDGLDVRGKTFKAWVLEDRVRIASIARALNKLPSKCEFLPDLQYYPTVGGAFVMPDGVLFGLRIQNGQIRSVDLGNSAVDFSRSRCQGQALFNELSKLSGDRGVTTYTLPREVLD